MKRPSIIDDIEIDASLQPAGETSEPIKTAVTTRKPRPDVQHTSVYLPRTAHERLREIAYVERCKIHDLIMEGVEKVITERGHPEKAVRSTKVL